LRAPKVFDNRGRVLHQFVARICQLHIAGISVKKRDAQFAFEGSNGSTHGWLGHVESFSGTPKVEFLGHGQKSLNVAQVHLTIIPFLVMKETLLSI
jgi:hypothetical protein